MAGDRPPRGQGANGLESRTPHGATWLGPACSVLPCQPRDSQRPTPGAGPRRPAQAGAAAATTEVDQSTTFVGLTTCLLIPSSLGARPEGQPDELGQVQDRQAELTAGGLGGQRLLQVEVEVAQRAGDDQAVGVGVDRVAE